MQCVSTDLILSICCLFQMLLLGKPSGLFPTKFNFHLTHCFRYIIVHYQRSEFSFTPCNIHNRADGDQERLRLRLVDLPGRKIWKSESFHLLSVWSDIIPLPCVTHDVVIHIIHIIHLIHFHLFSFLPIPFPHKWLGTSSFDVAFERIWRNPKR